MFNKISEIVFHNIIIRQIRNMSKNPFFKLFHFHIVWVIAYFFIAVSFLFVANDNSLKSLIQLPTFKTDLLFALSTTYLIGTYLRIISSNFDQSPTLQSLSSRSIAQILKGILLPLTIAVTLEIIYLNQIRIPIKKSSIFYLELPLILLFLIIINGFYVGRFLYFKMQDINNVNHVSLTQSIKHIVVQRGFIEEKVSIEHCAYIKSENKILWLTTFEGSYFKINGTLDDWIKKLPENFFRINRQFIVASKAILSIELTETRKLKVNLIGQIDNTIYISKANVTRFRNWWKHSSPLK